MVHHHIITSQGRSEGGGGGGFQGVRETPFGVGNTYCNVS